MALIDDLRSGLGPVVDTILAEFASTVNVLRGSTTYDAANRATLNPAPIAGGVGVPMMVVSPVTAQLQRIFGRDLSITAVGIMRDTLALQTNDTVKVTAGPHAGADYRVLTDEQQYAGSMRIVALGRERT